MHATCTEPMQHVHMLQTTGRFQRESCGHVSNFAFVVKLSCLHAVWACLHVVIANKLIGGVLGHDYGMQDVCVFESESFGTVLVLDGEKKHTLACQHNSK